MLLEKIKKEVQTHIGDKAIIKYNLGRNKYETYNVTIKETYPYVFLVQLNNRDEIKSFSYTDIMTKIIKINY